MYVPSARLGYSSVRVTAEIYSHMIHGQDDEEALRWDQFRERNVAEISLRISLESCCRQRVTAQSPQVYEELVALTGIEGANRQFSSVRFSPSDSKYVQLVRHSSPETCHDSATLSLGCH